MNGLDTDYRQLAEPPMDFSRGNVSATASRFVCLLVSLAWLTTLVLGAVALLRIFYHDGQHFLTWINAFTRYVYLPAYICLLVAIWKRRRWLALASFAIIACHLFWLAPDFLIGRNFDASPTSKASSRDTAPPLRIFFANVRQLNLEHEALLQEIKEAKPDVIVLVEFSGYWYDAFMRSQLITAYPHRTGSRPLQDIAIFSKLPFTSETQDWIAGRCIETIEIPLGAQTLRLIGLHAPRPMDFHDNDYDGYWSRVLPLLSEKRHPLVVVGDFNATQYSLIYQQIKSGGLRSAHEDRGRGYETSWPNGQLWVPPIRIDQAFLSPDVECLSISNGKGVGSDHKPFILDIQVRVPHE